MPRQDPPLPGRTGRAGGERTDALKGPGADAVAQATAKTCPDPAVLQASARDWTGAMHLVPGHPPEIPPCAAGRLPLADPQPVVRVTGFCR